MNQKRVSVMIIKISYLCTLHNEILAPPTCVVYMLWRLTPTCFSIKGASIRNFCRGCMMAFSSLW